MNRSATYPYGETEHITCSCGAQLEISITKQDGHNEKEDFNCPKCGAEHLVRIENALKPLFRWYAFTYPDCVELFA